MFMNIMYILLLISITGFLISGMLTILQLGSFFSKHRRYVKYFITFAIITIILMGVFTIVAS